MTPSAPSDFAWHQALHHVLSDSRSIQLHRQPIVDLVRGVTAGFELLARFSHPTVEAPPHHWFGAAYRLGLGPQLEAAVLCRALRLRSEAPADTFLTVNLDPSALVHHEVAELLLREGRLDRLVIELTEHTEIDDLEQLTVLVERLRERGALVAVDDTGTGYSGLARLLAVRPQFVKIDQAFVRGIAEEPTKRALVELVGHLASRIDAWVIAEGIETVEELREIIGLRVPLGQGYLLNRPNAAFVPVPPMIREMIAELANRQRLEDSLGKLAEPVPVYPFEEWAGGPVHGPVVLVDGDGRPVRLWYRGRCVPAMIAAASEACEVVATRAMVRPEDERFTPLVVTSDRGRAEGIVRIERLVETLAGWVRER